MAPTLGMSLFACPKNAAVEMEMIFVGRIEVGAERDPEITARTAVDGAQKLSFFALCAPMLEH